MENDQNTPLNEGSHEGPHEAEGLVERFSVQPGTDRLDLTERGRARLTELLASKATRKAIAETLGVSTGTLTRMIKEEREATPTANVAPGQALIERGDNGLITVTEHGLTMVSALAAEGGGRNIVAARLGISRSALGAVIDRDEVVRLAFESGQGEYEHLLHGLLLRSARKGNAIASIYLTKSRLNWRDGGEVAPQSNITITLPAPMSEADYTSWAQTQQHAPGTFAITDAAALPAIDVLPDDAAPSAEPLRESKREECLPKPANKEVRDLLNLAKEKIIANRLNNNGGTVR